MYYRNIFRKPSRNYLTLPDGFVKINTSTQVYSKPFSFWHPTVRQSEENVICNMKKKAIYNLCLYRQTPFKTSLWLMHCITKSLHGTTRSNFFVRIAMLHESYAFKSTVFGYVFRFLMVWNFVTCIHYVDTWWNQLSSKLVATRLFHFIISVSKGFLLHVLAF